MTSRWVTVVTIMVVGLIFVLIGVWSILPQMRLVQNDLKEAEELTRVATELETRHGQLAKLTTEKEVNSRYVERLTVALPTTTLADQFTLLVEALSHERTIQATLLSLTDGAALAKQKTRIAPLPKGTNELYFTLEVVGSYPDVLGFLSDLESGDRLIELTGPTITTSGTVGDVTAKLDGRTFWKETLTTVETNQTFVIDADRRTTALEQTNRNPFTIPPIADGRLNPFAPI